MDIDEDLQQAMALSMQVRPFEGLLPVKAGGQLIDCIGAASHVPSLQLLQCRTSTQTMSQRLRQMQSC